MKWSAIVLETDTNEFKKIDKTTRKGDISGDYIIVFYLYDVEAAAEYGKDLFEFINSEAKYFIGRNHMQMTNVKHITKEESEYDNYELADDEDTDFTFDDIWESEEEYVSKLTGEVYNKIKHWEGM